MPKTKKHILIAEDEKAIAGALEFKLGVAGFKISTVFNGEEAINFLAKNKVDLILLDLFMPKKDGFAVLEELKKQKNKTPIIVLSNLGQESEINKAKALGAIDYFMKSNTSLEAIVKVVEKIFKKIKK